MECPLCGKEMKKFYVSYYTKETILAEGESEPVCKETKDDREHYECFECGITYIDPYKTWLGKPAPTQAQKEFAYAISKKLNIELPVPFKIFYSAFIEKYKTPFYEKIEEDRLNREAKKKKSEE